MIGLTKEQYGNLVQRGYNVIPLVAKWDQIADPADIYEAFCPNPDDGGLLESGRAGRYSYVAFYPLASFSTKNGQSRIESILSIKTPTEGNPLSNLESIMSEWKAPRLDHGPDWKGGALGFLSYDFVQHLEEMPNVAADDLGIPELMFTIYRDVIAIDHIDDTCYLITNVLVKNQDSYDEGLNRLKRMKKKIQAIIPNKNISIGSHGALDPLDIKHSFSKDQFEQAVRKVQEYIVSGDVFQVNLSVRQDFPISAAPWNIYKTLRKVNPSPYMGYLHYPDYQIVSGSPELLIKLRGDRLSTRPIAGTRPRGQDREEDLRLAKELMENEKERAEHIMLVDLERNDLGRVCRYGTVEVTDLMVIEEYSHVMHIVSHVEGILAEGQTGYDAIRACFPGGTITGAPKIRTMEIIEELEPVKRGLYTGSIGWIGFDGDLELNIVIRTLVAKKAMGHVQAGAGIVIDSKPEAEYYESLKKAEALLKAVQISEEQFKLSRV